VRRMQGPAVVLLLAVAAFALVLAHDVRSWRRTLDAGALSYAAAPTQPVRRTAATILPSGISAHLLAVERDQQWLHALNRFTVANLATENADSLGPATYQLLHAGEAALTTVTQDPDRPRASQAYNLLAVLVFRAAYPGTGIDPGLVQEALTELQNAVRVDAADETAKENLELALRVLKAPHALTQKAQGTGAHATNLRKGAYGGPPGHGY
jgi:hypothetical protein